MCFDPAAMMSMAGQGGAASQEPPLKPMPPVLPRPLQAAPAVSPMTAQRPAGMLPPRYG